MKTPLLNLFDEMAGHRRRAATVAGLLECCNQADLRDGLLAAAAGLIYDELQSVEECAKEIQKEVCR
jgi:hypothetical protein